MTDATANSFYNKFLPAQMNNLIGRERELSDLKSLLLEPAVRLLTLTGPGGTGKTRLAIEAARQLTPYFADGAYFVSLASIQDSELVIPTIAQTLELRKSGSQLEFNDLVDFLHDRTLLVVIDNFEQVMGATAALEELLSKALGLKILITSRVPLSSPSEQVYTVPSLLLPEAGKVYSSLSELAQVPALEFFIRQARLLKMDFELTVENATTIISICRSLDGLPLALELAAARIRTLSPQALLAKLNTRLKILTSKTVNVPAHQQTLRATIDWSYNLLEASEQQLFNRLSVFSGGWSFDAALEVCGDPATMTDQPQAEVESGTGQSQPELPAGIIEPMLQSLKLKSLVRQEDTAGDRFGMLQTLREYAQERLSQQPVDAQMVRRRHSNYYLKLAQKAAPELVGVNQATWFQNLEQDHNNFREALQCLLSDSSAGYSTNEGSTDLKIEDALRLSVSLWRFWQSYGYMREGLHWLQNSLAGDYAYPSEQPNGSDPSLRGSAYIAAGTLARDMGDYREAHRLFEESLAWVRLENDRQAIANIKSNLGSLLALQGNFDKAVEQHQESLSLRREVQDERGIGVSLCNIAAICNARGEIERAKQLYEEALPLMQKSADNRGIAMLYNNYGEVLRAMNDLTAARNYFSRSLELQLELGYKAGCARSFISLGELDCAENNYFDAYNLFLKALSLVQEIGDNRYIAICLEGIARTQNADGGFVNAVRLLGAARSLRDEIGAPLEPAELMHLEMLVAALQAKLGEVDFKEAWSEGYDLPLKEVLKMNSLLPQPILAI